MHKIFLGLFESFKRALDHASVSDSDWQSKLIGFGCDGKSIANRLRGYLEKCVPWVFYFFLVPCTSIRAGSERCPH